MNKRAWMLLLGCAAASAQTAPPSAFPDDAVAPSATELRAHLAGRVFRVRTAASGNWRLEYKDSGYYYVNTSGGFAESGEWRVEDGRLCSKARSFGDTCNDARLVEGGLLVKRNSGEIIRLVAD